MGKYVLIEFDNDEQADRLCAQINTAQANGKALRLAGIFHKPPKKRCECVGVTQTTQMGRDRNNRVVARHKTTGFWYCRKCKRVRKGWQSPRNLLDDPNLPSNFFSKGLDKEASLHMNRDGEGLVKNYPLTTTTRAYG